jgi:serine O-acetyltransferase
MKVTPLQADTMRKRGGYAFRYVISGYLFDRTYRPMVTLRVCQATRKSVIAVPIHILFRWLHRRACNHAGIDLSWRTKIDAGFSLVHGWGVVISERAIIGKNVTFFNGVTIGKRERISRDGSRTDEYPVIEDEVWIGPHAIVVGGVVIGKGSRIAGGSFVTEDVPPFSIAAGNPAKVVKTGTVPDVTNPAP